MKIDFQDPENLSIFNEYIRDVWIHRGFSLGLFPNITMSDVNDCTEADGPNWNKPHITYYADGRVYIYLFFIPKSMLEFLGLKEYQAYDPDLLEPFHEIGHNIVRVVPELARGIKELKPTPLWEEMSALSGGKIRLNFGKQTVFAHYDGIVADEDFAEYFDDSITGKTGNEIFLQRIRDLLGIKYVRMTIGKDKYEANGKISVMDTKPVIVNSRTLTPPRFTHEALGDEVHYLERIKEVIIIRK